VKALISTAKERFNIIGGIVGQVQARVFVTALYYTLVVPFAGLARVFTGPLTHRGEAPSWENRPAVPTDIDAAREQG